MPKKNTEHIFHHTEDIVPELREEVLYDLIKEYTCSFDMKPDWCVWGRDQHGGIGLLYWVKSGEGSETIARTMSELINFLGGAARAEKTEWNESLMDDVPVYDRESIFDMLE